MWNPIGAPRLKRRALGRQSASLPVAFEGGTDMRFVIVAGTAVMTLSVASLGIGAHQDAARPAEVQISYDQFMKLDSASRTSRFREVNPETKAMIMRTHAERWLAANRGRLTNGQVALVQEAIDFVTPALYRNPSDPELKRKSDALEAKFKCRLRHSDMMAAFGPSQAPPPASWLDDMSAWFSGCLFG